LSVRIPKTQPTSVLPVAREESQRLSAADFPEADVGPGIISGLTQSRTQSADVPSFGSGGAHSVSRFEIQFLHTPVQNLCDVEFVFGRKRDLMNPAKLPELLTRIAEHTQHLSIKAQLVYSPRQRCPLSRAVRTWRLSRLRTGIDELGTVARPRTENADVCNGTNIEGTRFSGSGGIEDDLCKCLIWLMAVWELCCVGFRRGS
jgi:hypothetical protein